MQKTWRMPQDFRAFFRTVFFTIRLSDEALVTSGRILQLFIKLHPGHAFFGVSRNLHATDLPPCLIIRPVELHAAYPGDIFWKPEQA
ncbi:MAG: hypothetical protein ABI650_11470, partial [Dokdonella sp.]